jgi:hypothetical protein
MAKPITALVMALITWGPSHVSNAQPTEPIRLSVRLLNYANVPIHVTRTAEFQVTRVYSAAGIQIVWNGETSTVRTLDVLLLSGRMIDLQLGSRRSDPRVLAEAYREVSRAYIFTERVFAMASKTDGNIGDALGNLIAHEMGHLLLPDRGHSATGIMQPNYEFRDLSARRFTAEQAATIRLGLLADGNR